MSFPKLELVVHCCWPRIYVYICRQQDANLGERRICIWAISLTDFLNHLKRKVLFPLPLLLISGTQHTVCRKCALHTRTHSTIMAFTSLVHPHLEYPCAIWEPHLKKDAERLEQVQKSALKVYCGYSPYWA